MKSARRFTAVKRGLLTGAFISAFSPCVILLGQNSLSIPDQKVLPGQDDVWFPVLISSDSPIQGFQVRATFDSEVLTLEGIDLRFSALENMVDVEFFRMNFLDNRVEIASIFDFEAPFTGMPLSPLRDRRLLNLVFDVSEEAPPASQTRVELDNDPGLGRILNIFIVDSFSVFPALNGSTVTVCPPEEARVFIRGDVDGDETLTVSDSMVTLNYLFRGAQQPECLDAADFQDSGRVDLSSAVALLNFLFLGGREPSVPFPNTGLDPTPDDLPCP